MADAELLAFDLLLFLLLAFWDRSLASAAAAWASRSSMSSDDEELMTSIACSEEVLTNSMVFW